MPGRLFFSGTPNLNDLVCEPGWQRRATSEPGGSRSLILVKISKSLLVGFTLFSLSFTIPRTASAITFQEVLSWLDANRDAQESFEPGETITSGNIEKLEAFVPPGFLDEMMFPDFEAVIQQTSNFKAHPDYVRATVQHSPQTVLREDRSLANHIAGQPFSHERILSALPGDAAYMVAWNRVFRWQHLGYSSDRIHFAYLLPGRRGGRSKELDKSLLGGGTVERYLIEEYQRVYLSRVATLSETGYALKVSGSDRLQYKDYLTFTHPFEMRGSTFVIERPLDAFEEDQVNSYLPTERRVRRLSPKERADSFVGSEFTLDDFEGFSGRVLDYEWKYHGEKKVLHVADTNDPPKFFGPGSWVPKDRWQVRDCYVVEQVPHWEEHPYGRKLVFMDRENFNIPVALVFDRNDELLKVLYTLYKWPSAEDPLNPRPSETVGHWRGGIAINVKKNNGSLVWGISAMSDIKPAQVRRLFSVSNLTGGR